MAELVGLAASSEKAVRTAALKYLLDNYMTRYADYDPDAFSNVAFIPAFQGDTGCLARPHEVNLSLSSYVSRAPHAHTITPGFLCTRMGGPWIPGD